MTTKTEFEVLHLKDIVPSPTNPRKSFDLTKTTELAESIKEKGVLQPILVRVKGKKYEIVCGERRFRASQMVHTQDKTRDTIPTIIRDLDDQEVREMQLIENFQREDVHPMEEAVAIKYAIETGQYTAEDLKHKVGKSLHYIKQRMKLNSLSERWQELFFNGNLNITLALELATFPTDVQETVLEDRFDFDELKANPKEEVSINKNFLAGYRGKLSDASFKLDDATIDTKMGACTGCVFNTANFGLFPDQGEVARCTNITCFSNKTRLNFERELENVLIDPSIVLVSSNYNSYDNKRICEDLISKGHNVYQSNDYGEIEEPEKPDWEEYKDDMDYEDSDDEDKKTIKNDFDDEVATYEKNLKAYKQKVDSGKFKKGFIVDGTGLGKFIYLTLTIKKESSSPAADKKVDTQAEGVTISDIESEIKRIQGKELRSKEIDENKIWDDLKKHFTPSNNVPYLAGKLQQFERVAIARALSNKINYPHSEAFTKLFKLDKGKGDLAHVDDEMINQMCRFFFLATLPPGTLFSGYTEDAEACVTIAQNYFPSVLKDIQDSHNVRIEKRIKNVDKRIVELNLQKKELLKLQPKATPKKAAPKKAKAAAPKKGK